MNKYNKEIDNLLVDKSLNGDAGALEEIINRYKDLIFNFALRMLGDYTEAQDVSQEVLIKILTKLSTFEKKSSLKTWIIRITSNHIISQKRKIKEFIFSDFSSHNKLLDGLDEQISLNDTDPEGKVIIDEIKYHCIEGMLLCLNREQRAVFIIGAIMGIGSVEGAKAMDISEGAFRKRLSRARRDLSQYMNNSCSLISKTNTCNCSSKAKAAFKAGYISKEKAVFNKKRLNNVSHFIHSSDNTADKLLDLVSEIHRQVPIMELEAGSIKKILQSTEFKNIIGF